MREREIKKPRPIFQDPKEVVTILTLPSEPLPMCPFLKTRFLDLLLALCPNLYKYQVISFLTVISMKMCS